MDSEYSTSKIKFFAIFDNGLPAGKRYGMDRNGGNRWVGRKVQITDVDVSTWREGKDVLFFDYDCLCHIDSSLFRVVSEETVTTIYERNLSR